MILLLHGDCMDKLQEMESCSCGAVLCDPPYDLTAVSRGGSPRKAGTGPFGRHKLETQGFMGKAWDGTGIAFSEEFWQSIYRVLSPGGVVGAFGGTRTFHKMAGAMADAGFLHLGIEAWAYGSGFPKSLDVGNVLGDREAQKWDGWGTSLKPAWEPVLTARRPYA